MKILAIDTSSKNCSVAIVEVDSNNFNVIVFNNSDDEKTHSQKLMPMVDSSFKSCNITLDDIDLLACCLGPGSFTGIRIGIASVKAFADVKNIPTVGVTSLESLAYNVCENGLVCPIIDCKNNNVYAGLFSNGANKPYVQVADNMADSIDGCLDKLIENINGHFVNDKNNLITFVGDGSILHKDFITAKFANSGMNINFSKCNVQSGISLAKCAYYKYLNGEFGDSNYISPIYLRRSQAEREKFGE